MALPVVRRDRRGGSCAGARCCASSSIGFLDGISLMGSHIPRHGHSKYRRASPTYLCWANMIQRCTNPRRREYRYYGGRGIIVCERWLVFDNFLEDMGERPPNPEGHAGKRGYWSLDRRDNNGDYARDNCRWATRSEQQRNKRPLIVHQTREAALDPNTRLLAKLLTTRGIAHAEIARILGVSRQRVSQILHPKNQV